MIKYYDSAVTFSEFPDEIALAINISNCPGTCIGCSEPWLREDVGEELNKDSLKELINRHPGITLVGIMGGDADHKAVVDLANLVHAVGLKVGMYSGRNYLDMDLLQCLDYYKFGPWIPFVGEEDTWKNQTAGPLTLPTSNQIMLKREDDKWINITTRFRTKKINNWKKEIMQK